MLPISSQSDVQNAGINNNKFGEEEMKVKQQQHPENTTVMNEIFKGYLKDVTEQALWILLKLWFE